LVVFRVLGRVQVRFAGKNPRRLLDVWNPTVKLAPNAGEKPVDVDGAGSCVSLFDSEVTEGLSKIVSDHAFRLAGLVACSARARGPGC
jgi:hypothetical protein